MDTQSGDSRGTSESAVSKSISTQTEKEQTPGQRKQHRAPSPNDADRGFSAQSRTHIGGAGQTSSQQSSKDAKVSGVAEQGQGSETLSNNVSTVGSSTKSSTEGNAQSNNIEGPHSSQKVHTTQRSSVQKDIDVTNEIDQSTTTATRTVQSSSGSVVQDNSAVTHTVTNQQNVQHTDQVNVQTVQQTSHRTVIGQESQQQVPAPTIKRRPSSYQIPSTVSMQKLISKT